jgi:hypothetical protein
MHCRFKRNLHLYKNLIDMQKKANGPTSKPVRDGDEEIYADCVLEYRHSLTRLFVTDVKEQVRYVSGYNVGIEEADNRDDDEGNTIDDEDNTTDDEDNTIDDEYESDYGDQFE